MKKKECVINYDLKGHQFPFVKYMNDLSLKRRVIENYFHQLIQYYYQRLVSL